MKKYCPQCGAKYSDGRQRFCLTDGVLLSLPDPYRLVGNTLEKRYRIEALIGVGGFGAVYSAHQLGTGRAVAFKILKPDVVLQAPEADDLFEGEAKTAARLEHENIVTIYDAGRTEDGLSYIAMEWLEGRPLDDVLKAEGQFTIERTAELLRPIAAALSCAHAQRVVHRDLKPGNVMLSQRRGGGELVKVVDFGIAKVMNSSAGSTISRSIGTPHYSPPEQWTRGAQIDGRADVYALGVLLFELLTKQLPFNAQSLEELIRLKLTNKPVALRAFLPDAPAELEALLQRMMAREPGLRPQAVNEVPALFEAAYKAALQAQAPTLVEPTEWISATEMQRLAEPEAAPVKPLVKTEEETKPRQQPPLPPAEKESAPPRSAPPKPEPQPRVEVTPQTKPPVLAPTPVVPRTGMPNALRALIGLALVGALSGIIYWASTSNTPPTTTPGTTQSANVPTGRDFTETINGVKLEMKAVPAGSFMMGSPDNEAERSADEGPQHRVNVPALPSANTKSHRRNGKP